MKNGKIQIGVIGCGGIANGKHFPALAKLSDQCELIAFCDLVEAAGYRSMIYMGLEVGYERLDLSRLTDYDFWFAQYTSKGRPDMYYDFRIWQYSDKGKVPGIEGNVDMDLALIPY